MSEKFLVKAPQLTRFLDSVLLGKKLPFFKDEFAEYEFYCSKQKIRWASNYSTDFWLYFQEVEQKEWHHLSCYRIAVKLEER